MGGEPGTDEPTGKSTVPAETDDTVADGTEAETDDAVADATKAETAETPEKAETADPADEDADEASEEAVEEDTDVEGEGKAAPEGAEDSPEEEATVVAEGTPSDPDPADAARRRLLRALWPRATRSQMLAAVVCAVLGFAVVAQARQAQVQSLSSLRESDLIAVLDNVTQESARLDAQARSLQQTLDGLRTSSDRAPAARQAAQDRLQVLGVLAGTLPAVGPGIELELPDPRRKVTATEMLETVQELRDAGAEAMQIGSVRVVVSTALVDTPAGLLVDGSVVAPPYRLQAIGDPQTLSAALEIPGGVLEVWRGKDVVGAVHARDSLTISALRPPRPAQYAHPAPSSS